MSLSSFNYYPACKNKQKCSHVTSKHSGLDHVLTPHVKNRQALLSRVSSQER